MREKNTWLLYWSIWTTYHNSTICCNFVTSPAHLDIILFIFPSVHCFHSARQLPFSFLPSEPKSLLDLFLLLASVFVRGLFPLLFSLRVSLLSSEGSQSFLVLGGRSRMYSSLSLWSSDARLWVLSGLGFELLVRLFFSFWGEVCFIWSKPPPVFEPLAATGRLCDEMSLHQSDALVLEPSFSVELPSSRSPEELVWMVCVNLESSDCCWRLHLFSSSLYVILNTGSLYLSAAAIHFLTSSPKTLQRRLSYSKAFVCVYSTPTSVCEVNKPQIVNGLGRVLHMRNRKQ